MMSFTELRLLWLDSGDSSQSDSESSSFLLLLCSPLCKGTQSIQLCDAGNMTETLRFVQIQHLRRHKCSNFMRRYVASTIEQRGKQRGIILILFHCADARDPCTVHRISKSSSFVVFIVQESTQNLSSHHHRWIEKWRGRPIRECTSNHMKVTPWMPITGMTPSHHSLHYHRSEQRSWNCSTSFQFVLCDLTQMSKPRFSSTNWIHSQPPTIRHPMPTTHALDEFTMSTVRKRVHVVWW